MDKQFAQARREAGAASSYEILCPCGQSIRGDRQARRQISPCPACGRTTFVLPWSPLPSPEGASAPASPAPAGRFGPWTVPLIAAGVTLAILIVLLILLLPSLERSPSKSPGPPPDLPAMTTAGRRALADGDFHLAVQQLQSALDQLQRRPDLLPASERSDLTQLWRQADLLSRLSNRSLEEIVNDAELDHAEEWKAHFETAYKGKTLLFDDEVVFDDAPLPDGRRRPRLRNYRVQTGADEVRLALEDLNLLQPLARERPQRMLFGASLSAVERGPNGRWEVRFAPDSGVFLTDPDAAAVVCPAPLDPALLDVLKRQAEWVQRRDVAGE